MDDMISRQAAIDAVKDAIIKDEQQYAEDALKALPPVYVPDTNVGDMISRQAAIDALNEQIEQCNKALGSFDISLKDEFAIKVEKASLEAYKEQLENLPTVQPERMKGAWINEGRIIRCNKCKIGYATVKGMKSALTYNFCPNCGADMRGEQDE